MSSQHSKPYLVTANASYPLETAEGAFNEVWLQEFVFHHGDALPIAEIEPVFGALIPVCMELSTKAGPVDLVFINSEGLLTLVECKLWKNPEARREVVAQILDYAKEISAWSYEELEDAIQRSSKHNVQSLYKLVSSSSEDLDEGDFVDSVNRNLKRGRFLLLIVGGGIRENVEKLTDFLQRHAHMNFTLALVELVVCRMPNDMGNAHLVLPRVVAKTVEIERAVIRVEDGRIIAEPTPEQRPKFGKGTSGTRTTISEQAFYEKLAETDPHASHELRLFLDKARRMDLSVEVGKNSNSLMLKFTSPDLELNLGVFRTDGSFRNYRIARMTERMGHPEIGENYLTQLSSLFKGGFVQKGDNKFTWTVRRADRYVTIAECLAVQDKWLEIIQDTINQLLRTQEHES